MVADAVAFFNGEGGKVGRRAVGAQGEVGGDAQTVQQGAFVPQNGERGFVTLAVLKGFKRGGEGGVECLVDLFGRCGTQGEVADVTGGCSAEPRVVEAFAEVERAALTDVVNAIVAVGVEDEFAGVADVIFSQEGALRTLGTFDGGGEATVGAGKPRHHVRGLGEGPHIETDRFTFEKFYCRHR